MKRPLSVIVIACLYVVTGVIGLAFHATEFGPQHARLDEIIEISLTEVVAIVSGLYLLQGSNWARWLAVAWMAFHVIISFPSWPQMAIHALFCAALAYFLFRPQANPYFRSRGAGVA